MSKSGLSKRVLKDLNPKDVFYYFEEICSIPHGSFNEKCISDYLVGFANNKGLRYERDDSLNVIIYKEGTKGREDEDVVILQGHMDMVCEKDIDCKKDMTKEGLDLEIDGDYLFAKGTSLGADDGIAIAMCLAILADDEMSNPPIEAVFTVSEEVGLLGAYALDISKLHGKILLNLDSEDEGIFVSGCAGGATVVCEIECMDNSSVHAISGDYSFVEINVSGLLGGHSGNDIDKGRANACKIMGRAFEIICQINEHYENSIYLADVCCAGKGNAIPRAGRIVVYVDNERISLLEKGIMHLNESIQKEYIGVESEIKFGINKSDDMYEDVASCDSIDKISYLMNNIRNGVINYSLDEGGMVETSLNLGVVTKEKVNTYRFEYFLRSNNKNSLKRQVKEIRRIVDGVGKCEVLDTYDPWEFKENSPFRDKMVDVYKKMYNKMPVIEVIHAGLECGVFISKNSEIEAVSIGPDMIDIHSPKEKLSISSTKRVYDYIKMVLS